MTTAAEKKKADKAARNRSPTPEELESEFEDIDSIVERIERDQARLAAKKAAKNKPTRKSWKLSGQF